MKPHRLILTVLLPLCAALAVGAAAQNDLTADSKPQAGVPKGEVLKFSFDRSKIFPGTYRDYWVYVPAQYSPDKPACLYVNQDGVQWNAPTVFDNLIQKKEMPVTIGVFIMHGRVVAKDGKTALDRYNRSYEYDGLGDKYARFLVEELLPDVETRKTSDGRAIRFSKDPNDRAIGGSSSGAVCAFTAAWERPDQFSRVFSAIGTYVGLRGADRYPTLIRKYEPRQIRVFLQDGSNDQNIYAGDWWFANQMMERALTFGGYEVAHAWGEGGHSGQHGTVIFPDVMRWLWKGWPEPVKVGRSRNAMMNDILLPETRWAPAGEGYGLASGPTANAKGELLFVDTTAAKAYRLGGDGKPVMYAGNLKKTEALAVGPDGKLYTVSPDGVTVSGEGQKPKTLTKDVRGNSLVVANNGNMYVTEAGKETGKVWLVRPDGMSRVVDTGLLAPGGVTLSADQTLLYVSDRPSHWVYSYQIQPDGTLQAKQQYYWLHSSDLDENSNAAGMCVDKGGRLYVGTDLGIQVCDQPGRVNCILPVPGGAVSAVCFGGESGDILYAVSGGKVYWRKMKITGTHGWEAPNKPPVPGL